MIAIEKQHIPLSVKLAQYGIQFTQATTINGLLLITAIATQYLLQYPINYLLIPLIPFCLLTVVTILTTITAILVAAATGHLTETWEIIKQ